MSLADWKEREKEQRRNDILDAAMKLFYANGYDNVAMSDIAEKVGLKKPTLYLYFKNKEALFFAIVARGGRIRNTMVGKDAEKGTAGQEKFGAGAGAIQQYYDKYPEYSWAEYFFRSGRFDLENAANDEAMKKVLDLQKELFDILSGCVRCAMDDGTYRSDVDPLAMTVLLAMVAENISNIRQDYKYVLESGGVDLEKFLMDTGRIMKRAVTGDGTGKKPKR